MHRLATELATHFGGHLGNITSISEVSSCQNTDTCWLRGIWNQMVWGHAEVCPLLLVKAEIGSPRRNTAIIPALPQHQRTLGKRLMKDLVHGRVVVLYAYKSVALGIRHLRVSPLAVVESHNKTE